MLLRRVNAGVAGRKKKRAHAQRKQQQGGGLQRKNTIFGSRPRVERRLTSSSSTARGSSRMFYRSALGSWEFPRMTPYELRQISALTKSHRNRRRRRREGKRRPSAVGGGNVGLEGGDARGSERIK